MPPKQVCEECGKEAIGLQSFGCCTAIVCEEHAHSILRGMKPGQIYSSGECCFQRFGDEDR